MPHAPDHPYRRGQKRAPTPPPPPAPRSTQHDRIAHLLADVLGIEEAEATLDACIQSDLGADSLDAVEIELALEETFGVPAAKLDEAMDAWFDRDGTVRDLMALVGTEH